MCLIGQLHNGCFFNLNRVEKDVGCSFVIVLCHFFTAYLHSNRGEVSAVVFLVSSSDGVFLLRVSGSARFFPAVHTMCKFGNFIRIS